MLSMSPAPAPAHARRFQGFGSNVSSRSAGSTSLSPVSTIITCAPSVKTFSLAELESATDKFSSERLLGEGGFGRVYNGALVNGSGDREFISEVGMLCQLNHRNLVKLIGICIDGRTRCLVYEFIQNGSVESHLHGADRTRGPLEWNTRLKIALGAARGLAYLHEDSNPCVVHCDFKASNVLLEDDFTPKVSDFGLARDASEGIQHISSRFMGTFGGSSPCRYVAPEYAMTGHLMVKSDVYSFGVVLLELLSGRMSLGRPLLTSRRGLERLVDPSLAGDYDFDDMARVAAIASLCVHPEVLQRPFMGEVVQALKLVSSDPAEICDVNGEPGAGGSWWDAGTPRRSYGGLTSSFTSIERSSGPAEDMARRGESPARENRSAPLRTGRRRSGCLD
ncbi:unnamed protein product [Spirodela intermedia]|uniref:Protein kinase domain-containing protein n=1 Tax=Spirodela intermedia TaxID=51605 RepID=A0A7I8IC44_SPIIN|nr:unnamed protein product [Spirodela intermedia]CAA6655357.1 unnamed protein product [Spirodela intermedia]